MPVGSSRLFDADVAAAEPQKLGVSEAVQQDCEEDNGALDRGDCTPKTRSERGVKKILLNGRQYDSNLIEVFPQAATVDVQVHLG